MNLEYDSKSMTRQVVTKAVRMIELAALFAGKASKDSFGKRFQFGTSNKQLPFASN